MEILSKILDSIQEAAGENPQRVFTRKTSPEHPPAKPPAFQGPPSGQEQGGTLSELISRKTLPENQPAKIHGLPRTDSGS